MTKKIKIVVVTVLLLVIVILNLGFNLSDAKDVTVSAASHTRPNVLLIITDDQRADTLEYMPNTMTLLAEQGIKFDNAFFVQALCCPSRATILTGFYPHNHGCFDNLNCSRKFIDSGLDQSTIATWLQGAGYWNGLIGKYLNGHNKSYIPPGWSVWAIYGSNPYLKLQPGDLAAARAGDMSAVLTGKAIDFIRKVPDGKPFFLYIGYNAPHFPANSTAADYAMFANITPWNPPSFNEADVSDKPLGLQKRLLTTEEIEKAQIFRKKQLASLQGVDRAVARLVNELQSSGKLNNTVIIFTSDNGMMWGEHRIPANQKDNAYEEASKAPLIIRVPGVEPRIETKVVSIVDLPSTIADFAGIIPPSKVNGVSLKPLIYNPNIPWRDAVFLESISYSGVRTERYKYVERGKNKVKEFYDLQVDPYELENRASDPNYAQVIADLKILLDSLKIQ